MYQAWAAAGSCERTSRYACSARSSSSAWNASQPAAITSLIVVIGLAIPPFALDPLPAELTVFPHDGHANRYNAEDCQVHRLAHAKPCCIKLCVKEQAGRKMRITW